MYPAQPNRSLMDGLTVLQALSMAREPVGSRQLARELGLEPTRVNRLLKTLAGLGLARQTPRRKYTVGPGVHVLAAQALYGSGLLRRMLTTAPALHETGLIVALGVLWRDHVCYLYHGRNPTHPEEAIGTTGLYPAAQSGIGRVLLAHLDDATFAALDANIPRPELRKIRERGWEHFTRDETSDSTLAVPVGAPPYAAVAFAGRIAPADVDALLPRLRTAADILAEYHESPTTEATKDTP